MNSNFAYLRYPPDLYLQHPRTSQALGLNLIGKQTRKLFYKVPFTSSEINKIQEFKRYAIQHNKKITCNDTQILRYLYTTEFDFKECLQKISVYLDWTHDPAIQTLSNKARHILNDGVVYTYGRDKQNRPVVYLDLSKIKFDRYQLNDYYCAINAVLNLVVDYCFVHGVIQTYQFVIDLGGKNFTSLPIEQIGNIISKLGIVYSMYLGHMLVINTQTFVKFTFAAVKIFIHEETRKKITLLDTKQVEKMSQYIDKSQLYQKHRGLNPDPYQYWPPQVPGQTKVIMQDQDTVYYSLQQNQSFFGDTAFQNGIAQQNSSSCCNGASCQIF